MKLKRLHELFRLEGEVVINRSTGLEVVVSDRGGYLRVHSAEISIDLHRLKFALAHDWLPVKVDHEDRNKGNNLLDNLRPAGAASNQWNSKRAPSKKGLPVGVGVTKGGRYFAQANHIGKTVYLGIHDTPEAAGAAYQKWCQQNREGFNP